MGKPADATGESIDAGHLYRLVPNWPGYWDYAMGRPEPRAFRKDGDTGVSMIIKERMTIERIFQTKPRLSGFAVCELSIEELLIEEGVWVRLDRDEDFGDAHALVMGITKRRIDWLCEIGRRGVVKPPAPMKPDDRPA